MTRQIITRAQWGARHDNGFGPAPLPYSRTYLHQSVTIAPDLVWIDADGDGVEDDEEKAMRLLEEIGEKRFGGGISYTWCIPPSGRIYEGHSVDRQGAHTGGLNDVARAICLIGRYQDDEPTPAQIQSIAWLLQHNVAKGWTKTAALTGGHRDVKATECPGDLAYAAIDDINQLAAGPAITDTEDDDMAGEGPNILAFLAGGGPSTRVHSMEQAKAMSVDPTSIFGRLLDVQLALTTFIPTVLAAQAAGTKIDPAALEAAIAPVVERVVSSVLIAHPIDIGADDIAAMSAAVRTELAAALTGGA